MKKLLMGTFLLTGLAVTSCAKEYNCECLVTHTEKNNAMGLNLNSTKEDTSSYTMKGKEDDMRKACEDSGYTMEYKDQLNTEHTITSVCELK